MNTISKPCYLSLLQISAIYFPAFEKADCTIFALLVVVSPFFFLLFYHRLEQKETMIRIRIRDLLCLLGLVHFSLQKKRISNKPAAASENANVYNLPKELHWVSTRGCIYIEGWRQIKTRCKNAKGC